MKHLFGTDGVRGVAGASPLRPGEILRLGHAAGEVLREKCERLETPCRILMVRDTRFSGPLISRKLADGLRQKGIDVYDGGILSTPSAAYLVRAHHFHSGVVISASHNPPEFNGIKFFNSQGCKWPDAWEEAVEEKFFGRLSSSAFEKGKFFPAGSLAEDYLSFLENSLGLENDFSDFRLAIDCSHGANSHLAPELFRRLGATVFVIGARPNGRNINVGCGSQHTEKLSNLVLRNKCDAGIAFDGDGDRVIVVDEKGDVIDGDFIIAILARHWKSTKQLKNNLVVTTVMANLGLKKVLKQMGIRVAEVAVGDRYVSEGMRKNGSVLGGEQSGHIILGQFLPTGDGLLTSLHLLVAAKKRNESVSKLASLMKKFPQVLVNVRIKERVPLDQLDGVQPRINFIQRELGDRGRVLVRYSGTEPLLRIMLEGPDKKKLNTYSNDIARAVVKASGDRS